MADPLNKLNQMSQTYQNGKPSASPSSSTCPHCGGDLDPAYKAANKQDIANTVNDDSLDPSTLLAKAKSKLGL